METRENISLKPFNTFNIEARAAMMIDCYTTDDVCEATKVAAGKKHYVLGGGSNVLFLNDFDGIVIRPLINSVEIVEDAAEHVDVVVGAGVTWDGFVAWSVDRNLYGAENLSGIPGNVGAAPVQNIGAYGAEAKDVISSVDCVRIADGEVFSLTAPECKFGYRNSIFKQELRNAAIITHVHFRLSKSPDFHLDYGALRAAVEALGEPTGANVRKAVIATRDSKLPDPKVLGNAGSFFKNPEVDSFVADALTKEYPTMPRYELADGRVKIPAGWLIEQSGWKGRSLGPAAVHERQALVLVNKGGAQAADIVALCDAVRADVKSRFGIDLKPEVNFVG